MLVYKTNTVYYDLKGKRTLVTHLNILSRGLLNGDEINRRSNDLNLVKFKPSSSKKCL